MKIGLVGASGYWGKNWIKTIQNNPNAELAVVCDVDVGAIAKMNLNVRSTWELRDVVNSDAEGVIICTPVSTHYRIADFLIRGGKHILIEKPVTLLREHAEMLADDANYSNLKILSGHTFVYNSLVRRIKDYIDEGVLGRILYMTFQRTGQSPIRTDCNSLVDLSTHDISMALYWLGEVPHTVRSFGKSYLQTGIEDVVFSTLEFSNDVVANLHCSWYEPIKQRKATIIGTENMLVFDDIAQTITIYHKDGIEIPKVKYEEPLQAELNDFIDCIQNNKQPFQTIEDGLNVVKVLEMCQQSLKNNLYQSAMPIL